MPPILDLASATTQLPVTIPHKDEYGCTTYYQYVPSQSVYPQPSQMVIYTPLGPHHTAPAVYHSAEPQVLQQTIQQPAMYSSQPQVYYTSREASPGLSTDSYATSTSPSASSEGSSQSEGSNISISKQLELVWYGSFEEKFKEFPDMWRLAPTVSVPPFPEDPNSDGPKMQEFMDSAKVRFICPECSHCWTSMKGRVLFGHVLDRKSYGGLVVFKLFGQKCDKCESPEWVHAMWYPEEIKKTIHNVCQKVGQIHYGWSRPVVRIDRRSGRPRRPHNPDNCQACAEGICREEKNFA